jgi:hypothetical protein
LCARQEYRIIDKHACLHGLIERALGSYLDLLIGQVDRRGGQGIVAHAQGQRDAGSLLSLGVASHD